MPVHISKKHDEILSFLHGHSIGVLATVDPNGDPNAAAIYFTVDDKLNLSFITKTRTKKHDNLVRHSHAMLVVYEAITQTTVQIKGVVEQLTDVVETQQVFSAILKASMDTSESGIPPISKLRAGEYVVYRLAPKEIRMAVFTHPEHGDYSSIFETLST